MLLNAGAAFVAAGAVESIVDGIERAALIIDAGLADELLGKLRDERRVPTRRRRRPNAAAPADSSRARGRARVSVAESPRPAARNVVLEIAERRREDVRRALDELGRDGLPAPLPRPRSPGPSPTRSPRPASTSSPRSSAARRPPATIAASDDVVARARAYAAGGASAISVLCEPHWFGGSVDDLRAVRAQVAVPVLAKDFVVDPRQLELLRAAGADLVLLLAVLHPPARLAELAAQARDLGLEPLVEAHDAGEIEAALADRRAAGRHQQPRPPDARRRPGAGRPAARARSRKTGSSIAESGVRDAAIIARWRALGFDAALVGESLMRSPDPAAAARAFVAAGRDPVDLAAGARRAVRQDLRGHRRGGDPRRRPRGRGRDRAQLRPRHAARAVDR